MKAGDGAVDLRFGPSPIHGTGAFVLEAVTKGRRLIEYVGEKISKAESLRRCEAGRAYIFALSDAVDLDGGVLWNPARFINHSCDPNCEAVEAEGRIWVQARRDISAGEEVTFNYGYDLEDYREHPCRCGAPGCVGYMVAEELFDHLRRQRG